jgi:hypothetical protein
LAASVKACGDVRIGSSRPRKMAKAELDFPQPPVATVRRSQPSGYALVLPRWTVNNQLDRVGSLGGALGGGATTAHKNGQLGAQVVRHRLAKAHQHRAALAPGEPKPVVEAQRHLHTTTDQPASAIRTSQSPAPDAHRRRSVNRQRRARIVWVWVHNEQPNRTPASPEKF